MLYVWRWVRDLNTSIRRYHLLEQLHCSSASTFLNSSSGDRWLASIQRLFFILPALKIFAPFRCWALQCEQCLGMSHTCYNSITFLSGRIQGKPGVERDPVEFIHSRHSKILVVNFVWPGRSRMNFDVDAQCDELHRRWRIESSLW